MTLKADIDAVMSEADRVFGRNLTLRYRVAEREDAEMKILIITPKRRFNKAVTRNRLKRQLREIMRHEKPVIEAALPPEKALHLAIVYTGPPKMKFTDQRESFVKALSKISVLNLNNN